MQKERSIWDFFFKAHDGKAVDFSFCDKNPYLCASGADDEICLWDIRNMSKWCFTIKCEDLLAMEFFKGPYLQMMISCGNKIEILDIGSTNRY